MEEQEDSQPTGQNRSATRRAVDLARLINEDCCRLLELYLERECLPSNKSSSGPRLVLSSLEPLDSTDSPDSSSQAPSTVERVWHHRCALRRLLALLEQQIGWEEEELGLEEGEYEEVRGAVKARLGHLLHSTLKLLEAAAAEENSGESEHLGPDHDCTQGTDEMDSSTSYKMKVWTHHLIQDLVHWTDSAMKTLQVLHQERTGGQEL
ncbi:uncharacterized protein LOC134437044 isoform X2 [Engraulis encrasicolus]|uniref:uncharacterized protein LOC134437044 isoform X2 n=1 Tax=Engraulis encrasicolus TaxID=184585 RepID=UPI002FD5468E